MGRWDGSADRCPLVSSSTHPKHLNNNPLHTHANNPNPSSQRQTVNTSFYGTPTAETCAQWQQQVKGNGHFTFTLKMRSTVTHGDTPVGPAGGGGSPGRVGEGAKRRLDPLSTEALEAELPLFLERCEQLRTGKDGAFPPSLGVVLFQFPPSFEKSLGAYLVCCCCCYGGRGNECQWVEGRTTINQT